MIKLAWTTTFEENSLKSRSKQIAKRKYEIKKKQNRVQISFMTAFKVFKKINCPSFSQVLIKQGQGLILVAVGRAQLRRIKVLVVQKHIIFISDLSFFVLQTLFVHLQFNFSLCRPIFLIIDLRGPIILVGILPSLLIG